MDNGTYLLAIATVVGSILAAWLTARGSKGSAKTTAQPLLDQTNNQRIELLIQAYQKDRAEDALEINALKDTVRLQGEEIKELKAKFPIYRSAVRRLRRLVTTLGGDPGPWPEGLE